MRLVYYVALGLSASTHVFTVQSCLSIQKKVSRSMRNDVIVFVFSKRSDWAIGEIAQFRDSRLEQRTLCCLEIKNSECTQPPWLKCCTFDVVCADDDISKLWESKTPNGQTNDANITNNKDWNLCVWQTCCDEWSLHSICVTGHSKEVLQRDVYWLGNILCRVPKVIIWG